MKMIDKSCQFSFNDLHQAAFGRRMTEAEKQELYTLTQVKRNQTVGEWIKKAQWPSELRVGTDGIEYRAFWRSKD